ncbi:gamma-glutamylcyclotransferase [Frankia sp. AgPm24]|uniref:gamma-glutamylcyclotransferase family protein n=1 Tax=Frankia sp. AgPm24 TaxID=631128 RepID=UPI00200EB2D9|nr:gamma-glutamylcyclotransferase family protein [Frankia sp. AgPm24]MCK9924506.1 gamma-glutamylcyclotransferase [Frankia sp. AgPm24]
MSAPAAERPPLFVYGTLMFAEVLTVLLDRVPRIEPAVVAGWRAASLPGRRYPGLVPDPAARTSGRLLLGLAEAEMAVLDAFEGALYEVGPLVLVDGRAVSAYLWRDLSVASTSVWDPGVFAESHLECYARRCVAWRAGLTPGQVRQPGQVQ